MTAKERVDNDTYIMPFEVGFKVYILFFRFTAEEKEARNPFYYMPFSMGPRSCVGNRLALIQLKMAAVSILQTLKFVVCPETEVCS